MWSSCVRESGTTQVMYIAKLKDSPKRVKKTFSMILKWYDGGEENGITSKRIFEIEVFFSSQNIDFPFYLKRLLELFFLSSLFVEHALSLEDSGVLMIFEEKITSSKTSFQMASIHWQLTHIPEMGELWIYWR
jgi:hypothetical protein